LSPGNVLH